MQQRNGTSEMWGKTVFGVLLSFVEGTRLRSRCFWRRAHEQDLSKRHERDLGELSVVHHRETHIMLADFNKAQEVLKDKISALQILWATRIISTSIITTIRIVDLLLWHLGSNKLKCLHRLEGTEEKLRNRESRPEDLHVIAELREMVSEREALVKKLVVSRAASVLPRRNQVSCSAVSRTYQNLCVPGWQEVLPVGAGQQRDGIQQGLQLQCQRWRDQPSDQGEWSPVEKLRVWWGGGCDANHCVNSLLLSSTPIEMFKWKRTGRLKAAFTVLGRVSRSTYRLCVAKNAPSVDVVVKRKSFGWRR